MIFWVWNMFINLKIWKDVAPDLQVGENDSWKNVYIYLCIG